MLRLAILLVLVAPLVDADLVHIYPNGYRRVFPDFLLGPYCATRPNPQCCESRDDDCSLPMYGTRCYCDQFCDKEAFDCCPDFFQVCRGELREPECIRDGRRYRVGQKYMDNCNECTCERDGTLARFACTDEVCLMRPEFVRRHNSNPRRSWTAGDYSSSLPKFNAKTLIYGVNHFTGVKDPQIKSHAVKWHLSIDKDVIERHSSYDLRRQRAVSRILDQRDCNGSWAYGVAAHVSDKILYGQRIADERLEWEVSPEYLIDCYDRDEDGCKGGLVDRAHNYLNKFRGVTAQCYGSRTRGSCPYGRDRLPDTIERCENRASTQRDTLEISSTYVVYNGDEVFIKGELLDRGSVIAIMKVYSDFFMYESGVYQHDRDSDPYNEHPVGHIAVRIIGWGEERGVPYWICANNWGEFWGERGFFKIRRERTGNGESDITKFVRSFGTVNIGPLQVSNNMIKQRKRQQKRRRKLHRHKH